MHPLSESVAASIRERKPVPPIDESLTLDEAYNLQHQVTSLLCPGGGGGIKAGVTTGAAQAHFGLAHALLGSLYGDARLGDGCVLPMVEGRLIETEVAVTVDRDGNPQSIAPAIEIARVQFSRGSDMNAPNLVLANLGADAYIVGTPMPWQPGYDDLTVALSRTVEDETQTVNEASMSDALGGPESAIPWILTEANRLGFRRGDETLILTGTCGRVVPAAHGKYLADFGRLGKISFVIESPEGS